MILAGIVSAFAALCYSEFAASIRCQVQLMYGDGTLGDLSRDYRLGFDWISLSRGNRRQSAGRAMLLAV